MLLAAPLVFALFAEELVALLLLAPLGALDFALANGTLNASAEQAMTNTRKAFMLFFLVFESIRQNAGAPSPTRFARCSGLL